MTGLIGKWFIGLLLSVWLLPLFAVQPVQAQTAQVEASVEYKYGEVINFSGQLKPKAPVEKAQVFFRAGDVSDTHSGEADIKADGTFTYIYDLTNNEQIRAFSPIVYWFELTLPGGITITSPESSFTYEDNRFTWNQRERPPFIAHWYQGDTAFAQDILDVADLGLKNAQTLLPLSLDSPVKIYAYANAVDMRAALQTLRKSWIGAHADPDLGVMVLSLPEGPEQRLEMERQIPHELMHILLYEMVGGSYTNLPAWLTEGLASIAELYPNPDYLVLLENSHNKGTLPSIKSICQSFPKDVSGSFLAYAQSASFTRYLHQRFGSSGMESLVRRYADGLDCERGVEAALGIPLAQLERDWRKDVFGENIYRTALSNLLPWLVFLLVIVIIPVMFVVIGKRRSR
jgi:hypothetical protein